MMTTTESNREEVDQEAILLEGIRHLDIGIAQTDLFCKIREAKRSLSSTLPQIRSQVTHTKPKSELVYDKWLNERSRQQNEFYQKNMTYFHKNWTLNEQNVKKVKKIKAKSADLGKRMIIIFKRNLK